MTREEAIKYWVDFRDEIDQFVDECWSNDDAEEQREATNMAIAALREQPRWISVNEQLPDNKEHDWVLAQVVEDNGYMHIPKVMEYRQNKNDWFEETYGWLSGHNGAFVVTHWMPLPEPPEVEA